MVRVLARRVLLVATMLGVWLMALPAWAAVASVAWTPATPAPESPTATQLPAAQSPAPVAPEASTAPAPAPVYAGPAAPLCDDRGAVMFAPPPQIQDPTTSMAGLEAEVCGSDVLRPLPHAQQGRTPAPAPAAFDAPVDLAASMALPVASSARAPLATDFEVRPLGGALSRVERPPRR